MPDPITAYNRVAPPSDPASSSFHLDGELTKLERSTASLIAAIGDIPNVYATIVDLDAEETARIAADALKADITYVDAEILAEETARIAADALKADITYVDAEVLAEETARIAADALLAPLASPAFTGNPTAPTQTTGDNSTKLATTAYVDALPKWEYVGKTANQTVTGSTTHVSDTELVVPMLAGETYQIKATLVMSFVTGSYSWGITGPGGATSIRISNLNAYGIVVTAGTATGQIVQDITIVIQNGATPGDFAFTFAEAAATGSVTMETGSFLEYRKL